MDKLSVASGGFDGRVADVLAEFDRRIQATPPGTCPISVQLSLLQASGAQTCGKCVPCRDGIPKLIALIERIAACRATADDLDQARSLARFIRDSSDCAIGYHAGALALEGMDQFADEYKRHIEEGVCAPRVHQTLPCETMCPAHVDIPGYIALVGQGRCDDAIRLIRKDNPFPTACALVCEHPCEVRCRRMLIDAPVNIRGIKKYAVDTIAADKVSVPKRCEDSGKLVAVVGGGPSGMTAAYYLALMGHKVVLFEARKHLGGMMRYGIPAYRFPRERLEEDVRAILSAGNIEVRLETPVDAQGLKDLREKYDAVYVAIGAQKGKTLSIDGADAHGVISAVDMLGAIGDGDYPDYTGKKVAVIGGGNVAMDCARTAIRAGAQEVSVVYRRRLEDMTALPAEVESAIAEGVEMLTLQAPVRIEANGDGNCVALVAQPQYIGPVKRGRPAPVAAAKPELRIQADVVLIAVGQDIDSKPFEDAGMQAERHQFAANEFLEASGCDGVFVGGDCQTGPSTVIKAIGAGKVAARNIDAYLGCSHVLDCGVAAPLPAGNDRTPKGRVNIAERPARERKHDFAYVEEPMSREEAMQECGRCLRCDHFGCGVLDDGRVQYE